MPYGLKRGWIKLSTQLCNVYWIHLNAFLYAFIIPAQQLCTKKTGKASKSSLWLKVWRVSVTEKTTRWQTGSRRLSCQSSDFHSAFNWAASIFSTWAFLLSQFTDPELFLAGLQLKLLICFRVLHLCSLCITLYTRHTELRKSKHFLSWYECTTVSLVFSI